MTQQRIGLGKDGEEIAVAYLQRHGYRLLERNFRNHFGEIDIIAQDGRVICFIEVKTRASDAFGSPFESVTPTKQKKVARVAMGYLKEKGCSEAPARFDVVGVFWEKNFSPHVEILKNAFELLER